MARFTSNGMAPVSAKDIARTRAAGKRALARYDDQKRAGRKRLISFVALPLVLVLAVVGVVIALSTGGAKPPADHTHSATPPSVKSVADALANVPNSVTDAVGKGQTTNPPWTITEMALKTRDGKPLVTYVGAEYCPYCAHMRWPMAVMLQRFGEFKKLPVSSSELSFHGAKYTSKYIAFDGVETGTSDGQELHKLNDEQKVLLTKYTADRIPFIYIAGKFVSSTGYDGSVLEGKTPEHIAAALSDPDSPIAKAVIGEANVLTAAVCKASSDAPDNVCNLAGVKPAAEALE